MSAQPPEPPVPPSRALSTRPLSVLALLLVIGLIGFGGYRASEYQGMQTLRTDAGHRLDLFGAAVDGIVNRYAHIPATIQLNQEVLALLRKPGLSGQVGRHFAIGITQGEPGYYVSHPIRDGERVVGVAAIKIGLAGIDQAWDLLGAPALIADENGVVILSSVPDWRYTALGPLSSDSRVEAAVSRLYNNRPIGNFPVAIDAALGPAGQEIHSGGRLGIAPGRALGSTYLVHGRQLSSTGWRLLIFSDLQPMRAQAAGHGALAAVATGCVLLLLLVVAQRRRILRQKLEAKALLEQANAQLESKVARRTRALTDTNARLRKEVAERQQAEQTLRAAQDELVQAAKLAVLGQLAAGITHELAQPLGAMRTLSGNAVEFMKRGNLATVEQNLGIIARLADQMGRIITPLKTFARKSPAIPAATDVAHAVGAALFLLDQRLARAGITVINHCEPGRAVAWCDQNRLEQVLINLIRNAGDAMADSPRKTLTLAAAPADDGVVLRISDTGCGLPEGGALFEPFFTTKPPGEGLGLGLAISRDIVREFGGDLRAEHCPEGGACFSVHLPAAPKEQP